MNTLERIMELSALIDATERTVNGLRETAKAARGVASAEYLALLERNVDTAAEDGCVIVRQLREELDRINADLANAEDLLARKIP